MLTRLTLTDFRSYKALRFEPGARVCLFTGPNGSGKTNLLEALSLLVPGRGLRGAKFAELARRGADASQSWAVAARFDDGLEIGTAQAENAPERREFRLNGVKPLAQAQVAEQLAAVWLTPQMDRLFTDPAAARRKFLDRLVVALEPSHAREIAAFESASAQRNRLLQERPDPGWLSALEDAMARHSVEATAARLALIRALNATLAEGAADPFPRVTLALDCAIAARLDAHPAIEVEDGLRAALARARPQDGAARAATLGPQRADFLLTDSHTARPAALSSTGQQKSMLIGVVLGHAALVGRLRAAPPLLLLDEPLVHLDEARRAALIAALNASPAPAFLTGTDAQPFAGLAGACYVVAESTIHPA